MELIWERRNSDGTDMGTEKQRMKKIRYKIEHFYCIFSTSKGIAEKMQTLLDKNAAEGWKLHSWQIPGASASFCEMVFYKETEDAP